MNNNCKHAFLIMAHNNKRQLINLVKLLDYSNNELYVHIDKKVHLIDDNELLSNAIKCKIHILRKVKVAWGAYSQIECELTLLREAIKTQHKYYHLISGVDLPIKSNQELHTFFDENFGKEFVHFQSINIDKDTINHVKYYHLLQEYTNAYSLCINKVVRGIEHLLLGIQKVIRINRWDGSYCLQKGANWFSITDNLANYIVSKEKTIKKLFKYTLSGDELFLQTLVINSPFKNNLYHPSFDDDYQQCARYIDWNRGKPYVFQTKDLQDLLFSKELFARKCSYELSQKMLNYKESYNYQKEV